jgi:hypothetical protein
MSVYRPLPPIPVTAVADQSGFNTGNWTCHYRANVLGGINVPSFELYHAAVQTAQPGGALTMGFDLTRIWAATSIGAGGVSEYSPAAGWLLNPALEFYVFFNYAAAGTAPQICCWFRYDLEDPYNARAVGQAGG